MNTYKIEFSEPDKYGEIHARLQMPLSIDEKTAHFLLVIGDAQEAKYRLDYGDAGTVGYARMRGEYAVTGRLINISADWSNGAPKFGVLDVIGTIDRGAAILQVWTDAPADEKNIVEKSALFQE